MLTIKPNATLHTKGDGYWSRVKKEVIITKATVPYINEEETFGELRIYFDRKSWDCEKDGLIYTDSLFLSELKNKLTKYGLVTDGVSYSEQGMQGDSYVSLDVDQEFLSSWNLITNLVVN